jgi:transcriptional regulator with XRE-family HTH domain
MDAELGQRIRRLRRAVGLTQKDLADFAERSERWMRGIEAGRGRLDPETVQQLALGLRVAPAALLGLTAESGDDVKRREFLQRALTSAAGAALVPAVDPLDPEPWERLDRALRRPRGIDSRTINHLEQAMTALESLEYELAPGALIGPLRGHLVEVVRLLEGGLAPSQRRQLLSIAGETAATAGWLMWDLERPADVVAYFRSGLQAATDAGDRPLAAFIQASSSLQPSYRERPADRIRLLRGHERHATPRTRAWIYTLEGEALALAGDERGCLSALDRADTVLAGLGDDRADRRPRYDPFDSTRMLGERGSALVKLGRGRDARDLLESAMAALRGQPRILNSIRASYARALAQQGEVDGAVRAASEALDGAAALGTAPTLGALRKVVRDLRPWAGDPAVHQLGERLRLLGG